MKFANGLSKVGMSALRDRIQLAVMLKGAAANADSLKLVGFGDAMQPASQAGLAPSSPPDPAVFTEAVRNGGKLWPMLSHYLASLGQACLLRQRLASDLGTVRRY